MEEEEFDPATGQDMQDTADAFNGKVGTLNNEVLGDYDKDDLIRQVSKNLGINHDEVVSVIEEAFSVTKAAVIKHDRVIYRGFGSLRLKTHAAESGKDPQGEKYEVGERLSVEFNAGGAFKSQITLSKGLPAIS